MHCTCNAGECVECLRREVERLTKTLEEREADMHLRIRQGYDATVADCWRAKLAEVERERDAAYAASLRSDEVHAEAMRAVRARAEKAEAERDEARAQVERLRGGMQKGTK